jgi:DNA-binding HxlR family transcriptional regulator
LRSLVEAGLLTRDEAGRGKRATYTLTEPAIQLVPVLAHLVTTRSAPHGPTATERLAAAYAGAIAAKAQQPE